MRWQPPIFSGVTSLTLGTDVSFFKIYFYNLFFYFWLHWVFIAVPGLSLAEASGGYFSLWCVGFSLWWLLLCSMGSRRAGFSSRGTWAQQLWLTGTRAQAQQLWHTGLVSLRHVGSSWTRDQTCVPCIGRGILNHWTTREVPRHKCILPKVSKASATSWPPSLISLMSST